MKQMQSGEGKQNSLLKTQLLVLAMTTFFLTQLLQVRKDFSDFFTYILSHNTPTLPLFSIVKHFSVLIFLCLNLLALTITLMLSSTTPLT